MIRINLVREGRAAVRGAAAPGGGASTGPAGLNNILIISLLVLGLAGGAGYWFKKRSEENKIKQDVARLTDEAQKLEAIIKEVEKFEQRKVSLEKRIQTINDLKLKQKGPVRILDRISQDLPDLVWLDNLSLTGTEIAIKGRALNANAVANFAESIKQDPLFEEPEVSQVTLITAGPPAVYDYQMTFNFKYAPTVATPAAETAPVDGAAAAPGAPPSPQG